MLSRRAIIYGDVPSEAVRRLVTDYGLRVVGAANRLEPWLVSAFRDGQYDLTILEAGAEKADPLSAVVRQKHPHAIVVRVHGKDRVESIVKAVANATQWTPGGQTVCIITIDMKGGVGKSTVAGALSLVLSGERRQRVLVVDDNPTQANVSHLLTDQPVTPMSVEEIGKASETVCSRIVNIGPSLDLLTPEDYASQGGVACSTARSFWEAVFALGYNYVVVDTIPSFGMPDEPDEWMDISLTYALIAGAGRFPAVFVIPFTPDEWGWDGLTKTRDLLMRWEWDLEHRRDVMIPVVVCNDANSIAENIPAWLQNNGWRERLQVVGYNNRLRADPRSLLVRKIFHDPLKPYRPIVDTVIRLARKTWRGGEA